MLNKSLKGLLAMLAGVAMLSLAGCSTPCDAPGRLCAPIGPNTSAPPQPFMGAGPPRGEPMQSQPQVQAIPAIPPGSPATAAPNKLTRIGLMLPLRSEALGAPADAVRAGFMAAYERDPAGFSVNLIETGDGAPEALDAYAVALEQSDIVVGPLARSAVSALAASPLVQKPTIALNHPEARSPALVPPPRMLVMGLSIEDEARQVADWAAAENPGGTAIIVAGSSAWQRRVAASFAQQWKQLGHDSQTIQLTDLNGYLSEAALAQLRAQVDAAPPTLLFTALDASQVAQVRGVLGTELPCYAASSVNPGPAAGASITGLDGVRLLDLPWEVQPAHPAVMAYPRWNVSGGTLDMDRLYALGIDAYRVAREIALRPGADFRLDGVTGQLEVSFSQGAARLRRIQPAAVFQAGGVFELVSGVR
jgi:outer membrane PBP1 activator LpoA protein